MDRLESKPRIFLLIPCFMPHDAVGNDVLGMYRLLRSVGYEVRILAAEYHKSYTNIATPLQLDVDYWKSPNDILIYHHAIGWPLGEAVLARTRNRIVIKYHNITPARFFKDHAPHYYNACTEGELATGRLVRISPATFWGDSQFNAEELIKLGASRECCRWIPPCHLVEDLSNTAMDEQILGTYRDGHTNILFVGGMKPNKGHLDALRAYAAYRIVYGGRARLIFAGSFDPSLSSYVEQVQDLSRRLRIEADVVFERSVSSAQLRALYYVSDVFLCVSEHEGFCVPLIEAMAFRVPILAWAQTAVGETLGDVGMVHERFDPLTFGDDLEEIRHNSARRLAMADSGRLRYESEFHPRAIQRKLLRLVREVETLTHA
jgi:glycosyltransferase involved in cell wall biosynthesis